MKRRRRPTTPRTGLRVRGARAHPELRAAIIRFARWLRTEYQFPIRVPVYLLAREHVHTMHGHRVSASFFAPWSKKDEPYIRIAAGDYKEYRAEHGRDDALAAYLCSFAHEVVHYRQWIETDEVSERGVAVRATKIVRRYALSVDHP